MKLFSGKKKLISELIKAKSAESCLSKPSLSYVPGGSRHFQNFITVHFFFFFLGGGVVLHAFSGTLVQSKSNERL